ncbi:M20 metallopeptidase family protein [Leucobacter chromiireducens]|uniref:M20 metallopeptidase family protein n=1 Tax=Leucobacter chromiireducens TaxID=283877 RepID=UPI000F6400DD|nr:M20 family metallopeptidase [Leucobacter chromiireducens]
MTVTSAAVPRDLARLRRDADALLPELVELRRAIHRDPELGLRLPRTQERVIAALTAAGVEVIRGTALDSVIGIVRGGLPGDTVLLRGDMDALPMRERTGLPYAAAGEAMHACGHDLHVAGLVGAARLLASRRAELSGTVVLMFQPGEELGDGARLMLDEGLLAAVSPAPSAAYAIHVVPGEYGVFSTRPGPIMAGSLEFSVTVQGRGGHASAPHLAVDPVPVAADLVGALQAYVTRTFSVFDPVVLSVTQLSTAGSARNVIPGTVELGGTIRVLSAEAQRQVEATLPDLVRGLCAARGCEAEVALQLLCPATVNDADRTEYARGVLGEAFGDARVWESPAPVMGSEDFAYVLREVPGTLLFLRATPRELDPETVAPNHSPEVVFDDAILADQAAALAALALGR